MNSLSLVKFCWRYIEAYQSRQSFLKTTGTRRTQRPKLDARFGYAENILADSSCNDRSSCYEAGFTLIEVIVVVLMIGILSAIAAPSWIGFTNRQRINAVNDNVLRALQTAQQEAKKRKVSYSVSFKTERRIPQFVVHPTNAEIDVNNWQPLTTDLGIKPEQILLGTNLVGNNIAAPKLQYAAPAEQEQKITFDPLGNLTHDADLGTQGLIVSVALAQASNSTQVIASTVRCVKVKTLLGVMQTGRENDCQPRNN